LLTSFLPSFLHFLFLSTDISFHAPSITTTQKTMRFYPLWKAKRITLFNQAEDRVKAILLRSPKASSSNGSNKKITTTTTTTTTNTKGSKSTTTSSPVKSPSSRGSGSRRKRDPNRRAAKLMNDSFGSMQWRWFPWVGDGSRLKSWLLIHEERMRGVAEVARYALEHLEPSQFDQLMDMLGLQPDSLPPLTPTGGGGTNTSAWLRQAQQHLSMEEEAHATTTITAHPPATTAATTATTTAAAISTPPPLLLAST